MLTAFGVTVSVMFHLRFVYYTFSSFGVAECPHFWKALPIRLAVYSRILSICNFSSFLFGFVLYCPSPCALLTCYCL